MGVWKRIMLIDAGAAAVLVVSAACIKVDTGPDDPAGRPRLPPPPPAPRRRQQVPRRTTMPTSGSCAT